jgi:hypothetical protein
MHVIHVDEKCLEVKKIFVNKNAVVAKAHLFCIHHAFNSHLLLSALLVSEHDLPVTQDIADTMAYLQGEGCLLRGEHNHLCEAFLVMASSAGYVAAKSF